MSSLLSRRLTLPAGAARRRPQRASSIAGLRLLLGLGAGARGCGRAAALPRVWSGGVYRLAWRGPTAIWQPGVPATCGFGAWARSPRFGVSMARRQRPHLLFPAMSGLAVEER